MTKEHLKVGKQGTELNRIKYQLQIMVQYFIRLSQNLAYDTSFKYFQYLLTKKLKQSSMQRKYNLTIP